MKKYITIYFVLLIIFLFLENPICKSQGIWTYYTDELPGVVFDMTQDKNGNYWFATDNCVCQLDTNGTWHTLVDTTVWDSTMIFWKQIEADKYNNKWFVGVALSHATKEYVVKYDDSTFTYYNPSGKEQYTWITDLAMDSLDNIWAGSMANWAYWFDGIEWHSLYVPGTFIYDAILEFGTDRIGTLYIGHENGISTPDGYLWGEFMWGARSFSFDKDNRLWFGTDGWGVGVYDRQNWSQITTGDGLLSNHTSTAIDSSQNVWISYSTFGDGVSKFNGDQWIHIYVEDGLLDNNVSKIFVDKEGTIWFAHPFYKGLSLFKDTSKTEIKGNKKENMVLDKLILYQNYPNPFNKETVICYDLVQENNVQLTILNLQGKEVIALISENQLPGSYKIKWNGKNKNGKEVSSGIYLFFVKSDNLTEIKKMTLIK